MSSEREDLMQIVRDATEEYFREDIPEDGRDETDTIVDAILAAGWRPPTERTDAEVEAGFLAALRNGAGRIYRADIRAALEAADKVRVES